MAERRRICDVHPGDVDFLREFESELEMLTGMVEEMFVKTPAVLLSPVMRELLIEKARKVEKMHGKLRHRLVTDNPGEEPLSLT